ncbi:arylesterase [Leptospira ilyithenensis]|uniref:Arylesterase n=1 Tax=Leptospira ilyithenensis TaxID=2484901 RepID=A0A4V3JXA7_9LEPT|nr:arylesterase [Leptospira ilyithenensis]TGN13766.1 arylesterase [Leptospira ilyithenensis]
MKLFLILLFSSVLLSCSDSSKDAENEITKQESDSTEPRIIFFGDSLTAGYGLLDYEEAWPHLVVSRLKKEGFGYQITNAGVSGDTTSGGLGRIDWVLSQKPDIFVLELGANDMLRGISPKVTRSNLKSMIQKVKSTYPDCKILLVGMRATPNLGKKYATEFDSIYPDLAKEEDLSFIPFLLERVATIRKLNQKDGIHPTTEGHKLVAETVYPYLKKLTGK